ncbi:MAG: hypothetical protein L0Y44_12625 [Phycisphaerales bacterium]|nr:hypothetical protein [Phycisphaerales bacterium]
MKVIVGILIALVAILMAGFIWQATRNDLSAHQLAKALGMNYWRYRVPDSIGPRQIVILQVVTPEGVQESTGGTTGFEPGEVIIVALFPSNDGEQLNCSMVGKTASTQTHLSNNPLKGASITLWKGPDEVGADGALLKAIKNGDVSWTQTNPTETVIRVLVSGTP